MKILYITDALAVWGGIERVLSDKMNYLVEHGYDVYVITSDQGDHPIPFPIDKRVHLYDLDIRFHQQYKYRGIKRLIKYFEFEQLYRMRLKYYIREICPDIISCIRDSIVSNVLKVSDNIPVIFESHALCKDIVFEKASYLHRLASYVGRKRFRKLNMIVTLSDGDARDWKRYCCNTCIIPNVVHLNESDTFSECKSKNVIFVGRFDVQKNIGSLLNIWEIVQRLHNDWMLDIYGNGVLKPYFEKMVVERQLNVRIHPAVPNIMDQYKKSSMLIMSSMYEPFGLVLVEAMSCGLPVVAFDCPYGPADIINDGIDGFLVEDGNIEAFSDRVCQLMEDPDLRHRMGMAAVLSAQHYRAAAIMPQWERLFTKLSHTP